MRRAPWGARLLAAALVLSFVFAFTPCCEVFAVAAMPDAHAPVGHDHAGDAHDGVQPPGRDDPCAAWLERSEAVPAKAVVMVPTPEKSALPVIHAALPPVAPPFVGRRPFYLSASPPGALYLLHARLLL